MTQVPHDPGVEAERHAMWLMGRRRRDEVAGWSMHPTLSAGALVLIEPWRPGATPPQPGEVVAPRDPYRRDIRIVKRAVGGHEDGRWVLAGDNPGRSMDCCRGGGFPASLNLRRVVGRIPAASRSVEGSDADRAGGWAPG